METMQPSPRGLGPCKLAFLITSLIGSGTVLTGAQAEALGPLPPEPAPVLEPAPTPLPGEPGPVIVPPPEPIGTVLGASQEISLKVPDKYRSGAFTSERVLRAPPGFDVSVFAAGLAGRARLMALSPAGDIYISLSEGGKILALPDRNGDGIADRHITFAQGLNKPHGLTFRDTELIVAETGRLLSLRDTSGDLRADVQRVLSTDIPAEGQHWTRTVAQGPDQNLYVSVGSSCNVCLETDERRASILRFPPEGGEAEVYASGLRNAAGLAFHPVSGELWSTDVGQDGLGDDVPPEELNLIVQGGNYGWPHCYGYGTPDRTFGSVELCSTALTPKVAMQAHSTALGLAFGYNLAFPPAYQNMLYIGFRGSWDRTVPTGYKLVGVSFNPQANRPEGGAIDILSGWLDDATGEHWGRPVAPLVGADGALYLSDDIAGAIYRITWNGPPIAPPAPGNPGPAAP